MKSLTITPYSTQKAISKILREIVSQLHKIPSELICINFEEIPSEDIESLTKQKSVESLSNILSHVELNLSSLTIWL